VEAAPAEAVANGAGIHHEQADASQKPLLAQRILAEVVATRVAQAVRALPLPDDDAETAVEEMEEIAMLAERFAAGSAARNDRYDLIDLKDCASAALEAVGVADSATVVAELGDAPQVFASKTEVCLMLEQVLDNAAWAIRQKGLDAEEGEIRIKTAGDGDDASVTILDNGVGLSAEDRERMFLPFAGARDDHPGVGLAITQHIVQRYGGRIAVGSQPGGGTVLRISLPGMAA
ncbi:MAG: sensor histidine kinase, partial [Gammaproteobacteria bacterium]|nr:sensor histidine kinase [Gammaproteobacteria bacterium]